MSAARDAGARWDARYETVAAVTAVARLATATKAFCNCAVADGAEPNEHTCPVCLGLPGTLPVLNARAVECAASAALALGADVQLVSSFSREHRPPSPLRPKGYVLTQHEQPLARRGMLQIGETPEGAPIQTPVRCAYLTEDVGRGVHGRFADESGLDYNLAGAPLLVVEGAAELRSPAEVRAYVASLAALLRDVGAWAGALGDGTLAVTARVAIRGRGDLKAGEPCDLRHLTTLDDVEQAVEAECARQAALRDAGTEVDARARLWDAEAGAASPARTPESTPWYLVDPDLPPLVLTAEWIEARRDALPELGPARRERLRTAYRLDGPALEAVTADLSLAEYYESVARLHGDGPAAARWLQEHVLPFMAREGVTARDVAVRVRPADLARVLDRRRAGRLSDDAADRVFRTMLRTGLSPERAAAREGYVLADPPAEPDRQA